MSGTRRGKLKEEFEGMHTNLDWFIHHANKSLLIIGEDKPDLSEAILAVSSVIQTVDEQIRDLYSKI